jgi:threonyl-tRNA synthetase
MDKMDNIEVGKKFGLYFVDEKVGKGLPMLLPKGATIRRILERFIIDEELRRGYQHVITPDFAKIDLYKTSGHWPLYKESMYPPFLVDDKEYLLKPMTCPHHITIYKHEPHSYHALPIRYAELAHQYRREQSGELHGLIRVRMFTLADAHIFCTPDQMQSEFKKVVDLIQYVLKSLGIKNYWYRISLRDKTKTKYIGSDELWDKAENAIRKAMKDLKLKYVEAEGEAAFYGPKLDIQVKNTYGKEDTLLTNQIDFQLPDKFNLSYVGKDGKKKVPVMIHRASLGCIERTMAFLFEQYQGEFPIWLSPIQVRLVNMNDDLIPYSDDIVEKLRDAGFRVDTDYRSESVGKKVREAEVQKIPYIIVIGPKEKDAGTLAVRSRGEKPKFGVKFDDLVKEIKTLEENKK